MAVALFGRLSTSFITLNAKRFDRIFRSYFPASFGKSSALNSTIFRERIPHSAFRIPHLHKSRREHPAYFALESFLDLAAAFVKSGYGQVLDHLDVAVFYQIR